MDEYKIVNVSQLERDLTTVADSIRKKSGGEAELEFPGGYVTALDDITGGSTGGADTLTAMLNGTLSEYSNSEVTTIPGLAFHNCSSLTSVDFPACTTIENGHIYSYSRYSSYGYTTVYERYGAFARCNVVSVGFPACTYIGSCAFCECSSLQSVNFPTCTSIGSSAFYSCSALSSVNIPTCTSIGIYAFGRCSSLQSVNFPTCTSIGNYAFGYCASLRSVSLPACTSIGDYAFSNCYALSQIYLRASSVCTLAYSTAFFSTPYTGYKSVFSGTPYIYVPSSLVASYKAASNWSYFSKYISAL